MDNNTNDTRIEKTIIDTLCIFDINTVYLKMKTNLNYIVNGSNNTSVIFIRLVICEIMLNFFNISPPYQLYIHLYLAHVFATARLSDIILILIFRNAKFGYLPRWRLACRVLASLTHATFFPNDKRVYF